jgi:photosystem II stability/assembly factor-like uncharacterized protein
MTPPSSATACLALAVLLTVAACSPPGDGDAGPTGIRDAVDLTRESSGTEELLQAVAPLGAGEVWVSGHGGTWARTTDGGRSWRAAVVPGADSLQFRDVAAFPGGLAYLLSAGTGPLSRIYRTDDGGESWDLQFTAEHPDAFLDCMAFWTPERGIAYGDAVDGTLFILRTVDGGATWARVPTSGLPPALDGEGGFAASGACVATGPESVAWIATGNGARARVLRTDDEGLTWTAVDVPVVAGPSSGLTAVAFVTDEAGMAAGGTIGGDTLRVPSVAVTRDGGRSWDRTALLAMEGPAYGLALTPTRPIPTALAVGPGGMDLSPDMGATWERLDTLTHWAVAFTSRDTAIAVGPEGRITRVVLPRDGLR